MIILDDCSTDNSKEIIEQYRGHNKVSNISYNEKNSGNTFKQWDKGIQLAKGDYIWIAESDDWCENILLETLMIGIERESNCVIGYCQSYCVTESNSIKFQSNHTKLEEYIDGNDFIKKFILPHNPIFNAGMAIWRKSVYNTIAKDFIHYKLIGDYYFWIELCMQGNVFISGKLLNYFRNHEKNVSVNSIKNGLIFTEQIPLLKQLLDKKIIDKEDYFSALKKCYASFRFSQKNMSNEIIAAIKKLFSANSKISFKLEWYFHQKLIQSFLRKALKA